MEKLYYTIAQTAEKTGISMSNLRFWETEIPQLKPHRNERRTRFYTEEDIQLIKNIDYLQKTENLTLDGVRERLRNKKDEITRKQQIYENLISIKNDLKEFAKNL
jgi:DNA-binding transcriptional MerR regulator